MNELGSVKGNEAYRSVCGNDFGTIATYVSRIGPCAV